VNIASLIEPSLRIAQQAGADILEVYQSSRQFEVQVKPDHSPLTQADLLANERIQTELKKLTPHIPILSEESDLPDFHERQTWEYYWCVDPLDGTREFIRHTGEFTVNIALIHHHAPVLGVIYVPVIGEYYYACSGQGAIKRDVQGKNIPITVSKWQPDRTLILASQGVDEARLAQRMRDFPVNYQLRKMSSAWKFGLIAEGKADLYPRMGDTYEWDTAAGQCILEQAGGMIIDSNRQALRYNTKESLLNSHFIALGDHQSLLKQLNISEFFAEEKN
jgi:3'(2'), 5'-bisphosphate nucleotidase